jgi:hypothetical protein
VAILKFVDISLLWDKEKVSFERRRECLGDYRDIVFSCKEYILR